MSKIMDRMIEGLGINGEGKRKAICTTRYFEVGVDEVIKVLGIPKGHIKKIEHKGDKLIIEVIQEDKK